MQDLSGGSTKKTKDEAKDGSCYARVLLVELKPKLKDSPKTRYYYRFLFVPVQPNGLVIKESYCKSSEFCNN